MSSAPSFWSQAVPLLLILPLFYALVIRPGRMVERDRRRAVRRMLGGETVLTAAGMIATVTDIDHGRDEYGLDVGNGVMVKVKGSGISEVRAPGPEDRVRVDVAGRRLAASLGAPLPGFAVFGWAGKVDRIIVLHRDDRKDEAAKAPADYLGYPVEVSELNVPSSAPTDANASCLHPSGGSIAA